MSQTDSEIKSQLTDTFIREVRVNYLPSNEAKFKVLGPADAVGFLRSVFPDNSREHLLAVYLDSAHQIVCFSLISTGTANSATVHPREVFQRAILSGAIAIIDAHNHPTDNITPSKEDRDVTNRLKECGDLLGIRVLDSLIITSSAAYSILNNENL